jgi:hypothetical protein
MEVGQESVVVGIISKLLTDLVARNDQVHARPSRHLRAVHLCLRGESRCFPLLACVCLNNLSHTRLTLVVLCARWQLPLAPTQVTPFHSSRPPAITVKNYLEDRYVPAPLMH